MAPYRRALMLAALGLPLARVPAAATAQPGQLDSSGAEPDPVRKGRALRFPRDHGAHLSSRIEWWYATGWLGTPQAPTHGFQITFFRSATGLAAHVKSRFAARHLLFAHAALTTLPVGNSAQPGKHQHDQRMQRWSGAPQAPLAHAGLADAALVLGNWRLHREGNQWLADLPTKDFRLTAALTRSQPLLLQGEAGYSSKGPGAEQASHYYTEPQLAAAVVLAPGAPQARASQVPEARRAEGRAWLDHEWSDQLLHPQAVGWDWMGINLFDGSALTAFVLRRADGSTLWAGGSFRTAAGQLTTFTPQQLKLQALRRWRSPSSGADYPVVWQVDCPAGRYLLRSLMDAQELDGNASTGAVYWEGLSELSDSTGKRVGLGYLEMTGYASPLRLP
jgi:predicted secreted hydrolase